MPAVMVFFGSAIVPGFPSAPVATSTKNASDWVPSMPSHFESAKLRSGTSSNTQPDSQPSPASWSRSANIGRQVNPQLPFVQNEVAFAALHELPHVPQWYLSLEVSVSQPST